MHLYLHVPFCARRCSYCDFAIAVRRVVPSAGYTQAIEREWESWQGHAAWNDSPILDTIYFGGGTPSYLAPGAIEALLSRIRRDRPVAEGAEITLEVNPDDVNADRADAWRRAGVNRISLGAQSFEAAVLSWMHRIHTADQIRESVAILRKAGFEDLSLDLIYAVPRVLERDWKADLDRALALEPTHISLYGLTVEPATPLGKWTARGEAVALDDAAAAEQYLDAHARLTDAGYDHYEVSNAARLGFRARHNSAYWRRAPFLGLGPSAHSGFGPTRRWNVRDWEEYRRRIEAGLPVLQEEEHLSPGQVALEEQYLGLRTRDGLPEGQVPSETLAAWIREGWATLREARIVLTPEGWLRLDALVASLSRC